MSNGTDGTGEFIPSEIVNVYQAHIRRVKRRKDLFEALRSSRAKGLEPLAAENRGAVHAYEDHFDEFLLKYRRDPNKMQMGERDPQEVRKARLLKRRVEETERAAVAADKQLTAELRETSEYQDLQKATDEFEDWLSEICIFLKCCAAELDWTSRRINRTPSRLAQIPESLLIVASGKE